MGTFGGPGWPPRFQAFSGRYLRYLRYWVAEAEGKIFCLVEAPSPDAASTVHRDAHGLVADDVFLVRDGS